MSKSGHKGKPQTKCSSSSESESSSSSSSSSSSLSEEIIIKKHHKKHHEHKEKKNSKKGSKKGSKKNSKKGSKKCSNKSDKCSESSHSESSHKEKYCFDDVYRYYKNCLVKDDSLMVAGSNAYINAVNNIEQIIPQGYPVSFNENHETYNVDHPNMNAPFCVREGGIYIIFFIIVSEQASQFTLFINGIPQDLTTTGNNAGAGQIVFRHMISLEKDDSVVIRNYQSASSAIESSLYVGGLNKGNNETFLLMKVAPLPREKRDRESEEWSLDCLSKRKQYLFKKILDKMLCDKELMLKGFNVHGSFNTTKGQIVLTEGNVLFDSSSNVAGLGWSDVSSDQIKICEDGVYKVFFLATTTTACQFTVYLNGNPIDHSTQGSNRGAGQTSIRVLVECSKGDVLTIKNHTSFNSQLVISEYAGGVYPSISAITTVFKIAPKCKPSPCDFKLNRYHEKCCEEFKKYLLHNKCLQVAGSPAYINLTSTTAQTLVANQPLSWEITNLKKDFHHRQCTTSMEVKKDGIYDIFADLIVNEPGQLTLFINGTPDMNTTFGRDSGANRLLMRQFIKLSKGDIVEVRNYESLAGSIHTPLNSGGSRPGHPCYFMAFLLSPDNDWTVTKSKK